MKSCNYQSFCSSSYL